uniref:Exocyst complex component Sec8 n=1 Tax=Caenorhabditis tropicalis TaxID=1561998 RepID=A0A1I7T253_9PELO
MNDGGTPVAAVRRQRPAPSERSSANSNETGLLINVIRSLTTSVSEDQREVEKSRLEKGYKESGVLIDRLVKNHQQDVEKCLVSFRDVSAKISNCRERIHNVRNALHTVKSLLELRRDDLKKLWHENAQQKSVCEIMAKLEELRDAPSKIEILISKEQFQQAADTVTESKALINGRLSRVEGLSHLSAEIERFTKILIDRINDTLVNMLVVEPFEKHLFHIIRTIPESRINQNRYCLLLYNKARSGSGTESSYNGSVSKSRIVSCVEALSTLFKTVEERSWDVDRLMMLGKNMIDKMITNTVLVMKIGANIDESNEGDTTHLKQLMQLLSAQFDSASQKHAEFGFLVEKQLGRNDVVNSFWRSAQSAIEVVVSEHLDINPLLEKQSVMGATSRKQLFKFENTACAAPNTNSSSHRAKAVICKPSAYNIKVIFPILSRIMETTEKNINDSPCELRRFMHSFVMRVFVERVKGEFASRIEGALRGGEAVRISSNKKILPSCEKVLTLCKDIHDLITSIELYADRFAALWILVLTDYFKNMTEVYEKMTPKMSEPASDTIASRCQKISAAWTADDDISRLLMSLPNWNAASMSPSTPAVESEMDVGERNKRESEILIGNLGTQAQNSLAESNLITDMNDIKMFASLHESLRWFSQEIRELVHSLPANVKMMLDTCMVQVQLKDGQMIDNNSVPSAIEDCVRRLESIADSCLLLLHIEIRVHCFFHLAPLAKYRNTSSHSEADPEVVALGKDLHNFHDNLKDVLSPPKLSYVFDGLGHLCASLFIHYSQFMPRLTEAGKKRVCRNVWGVQQRLSRITNRRESDLDRARAFFDLLQDNTPDGILAIIPEKRSQFTAAELNYLLALSVRSDKTLSNQPGALEKRQTILNSILSQRNRH